MVRIGSPCKQELAIPGALHYALVEEVRYRIDLGLRKWADKVGIERSSIRCTYGGSWTSCPSVWARAPLTSDLPISHKPVCSLTRRSSV